MALRQAHGAEAGQLSGERRRRAAGRAAGRRPLPHPRRAVRHHAAGRPRRRGDQGRGAARATTPGPGSRRSATGSPPTTWASTATSARSPSTSRDPADAVLARELVARADIVIENFRPGGLARFGLDYETVAAAEPHDHLRLDQRLRQRREGRAAARLRPDRAGHLRADEPDRRPGRSAVPGGDLGVRRDGRAARHHRRAVRAAQAARDRPRPARRGQPALLRPVRAGQPLQRVRRRRHGAVPDGQQPPQPVPVRAAALRRRRPDHHRRQRRPVRASSARCWICPSWSTTRGSPTTRTGPPTGTSCGRCWWSGWRPGPSTSGSATSSAPACRADRSTPSTPESRSPRRSGWTRWSRSARRGIPCPASGTRSRFSETAAEYRLPPPGLDEHGAEIRAWLEAPEEER